MAVQHRCTGVASARQPVQAEPGVIVHSTADRRLACGHWLLSTLPDVGRDRAREEWDKCGVAILPVGSLFSAVRIPGSLLYTVTGDPQGVDEFLREWLDGGPVICDPHRPYYYALVPAGTPRAISRRTLADWRAMNIEVLGRESFLGVPRLNATELDPRSVASYWSVPMDSPAMLCQPLLVGRLIDAARRDLGGSLEG